jgi:hypothetical protein
LFFPEAWYMKLWDLFTTIGLITACGMTPYGLAFDMSVEGQPTRFVECYSSWTCTEFIIDMIFIVEIFVSINTSVINKDTNKFITNRTNIFWKYATGWLAIDIMAVAPRFLGLIGSANESTTGLLGILKFARISRIIKLVRLLKLIKMAKGKQSSQNLRSKNSTVAIDRIIIFSLVFILLIHTSACIWIFISNEVVANYNENPVGDLNTWVTVAEFEDLDNSSLYWASVYFTVTTVTTVGYGDLSARNTPERMLGILSMILGVVAFSYATGALSSLIHTDNARKAAYQ